MDLRIQIDKPCIEPWETMRIGLRSRFCENCQKNVIDFTGKSKREMLEYLLSNRTEGVCGRVYRSQLDFSNTDLLVTIQAIYKRTKNQNVAFYLLTVGAMLFVGCEDQGGSQQTVTAPSESIMLIDSTKSIVESKEEIKPIEKEKKQRECNTSEVFDDVILGDIDVYHDSIYIENTLYHYVDVMPEFNGGIDSLMSYVRQNLEYPEWEKENKIEGTVVAQFVIDKSGKIKEPIILRAVPGSQSLETEVIRVINNMPAWTPGKREGKPVDVIFNLPIKFAL